MLPLLKEEQEQIKAKVGDNWKENDLVFTNWCGEPMGPRRPYKWLKTFCERENLPFKFIHRFRHSIKHNVAPYSARHTVKQRFSVVAQPYAGALGNVHPALYRPFQPGDPQLLQYPCAACEPLHPVVIPRGGRAPRSSQPDRAVSGAVDRAVLRRVGVQSGDSRVVQGEEVLLIFPEASEKIERDSFNSLQTAVMVVFLSSHNSVILS